MMAGRPILANSELRKAPWIEREDIGYLCPYGSVEELDGRLCRIRDYSDEAMRTASAPTAFPTKPIMSIGWPAAAQRTVIAR